MGILGTSNGTVLGAVQAQGDQQFKSMNNLLSLQDNHVEEFFNIMEKCSWLLLNN